jgi:hypothetical protein
MRFRGLVREDRAFCWRPRCAGTVGSGLTTVERGTHRFASCDASHAIRRAHRGHDYSTEGTLPRYEQEISMLILQESSTSCCPSLPRLAAKQSARHGARCVMSERRIPPSCTYSRPCSVPTVALDALTSNSERWLCDVIKRKGPVPFEPNPNEKQQRRRGLTVPNSGAGGVGRRQTAPLCCARSNWIDKSTLLETTNETQPFAGGNTLHIRGERALLVSGRTYCTTIFFFVGDTTIQKRTRTVLPLSWWFFSHFHTAFPLGQPKGHVDNCPRLPILRHNQTRRRRPFVFGSSRLRGGEDAGRSRRMLRVPSHRAPSRPPDDRPTQTSTVENTASTN